MKAELTFQSPAKSIEHFQAIKLEDIQTALKHHKELSSTRFSETNSLYRLTLLSLFVLTLGDAITTSLILKIPGGVEKNPIMNELINYLGPDLALTSKVIIGSIAGIGGPELIRNLLKSDSMKNHPQWYQSHLFYSTPLVLMTTIQLITVLHNIFLLLDL